MKENARRLDKRIVLPEGTEERTLEAADILIGEGIARVTLVGKPDEVLKLARAKGLKHVEGATLVDPARHDKRELYAELLLEARKGKGMTREAALDLVLNPLYLGVLMIKGGTPMGRLPGPGTRRGTCCGRRCRW